MFTEELSQELSVADYLAPASVNASNATTTGIDMSKFKRVMYEITVGTMTGASAVDANLQSSASSNFASGVHNMTSTNITQVTNLLPNTVVTIETTDAQVAEQNSGDRYVRLLIKVSGNSVIVGAVGLGASGKHEPASAQDVNAVDRDCLAVSSAKILIFFGKLAQLPVWAFATLS